jgi:glycosyltransferase involved in cell wall biosynthesis
MTGLLMESLPNPAWDKADDIRLSVLIPFYRDDPRPLLQALASQLATDVELIAFDDGRPDAALCDAVHESIRAIASPAALLVSRVNRGRSAARNRLAQAARGDWVLFLDADMQVSAGFIQRWLDAIDNTSADVLFGGYAPAKADTVTRVHAALAQASDGLDASGRAAIGATAVCSSNLAVRRSVMKSVPFDEGYAGWGWEDVDWALSAAQGFKLGHVDNRAIHSGLESVPDLLAKFACSGANFARLLQRHPNYAARPGARLARLLRRLHAAPAARLIGKLAARTRLPVRLRVLGLKLFRAGVAAEEL